MSFRVEGKSTEELATDYKDVNAAIAAEVAVFFRKIDPPHNQGDSVHAHMKDTSTLLINGKWVEGDRFRLPPCVLVFLQVHGFTLPENNDQMKEFPGEDLRPIEFSKEDIRAMTNGKELPATMRKMDRANRGDPEDHIHFLRDANGVSAEL